MSSLLTGGRQTLQNPGKVEKVCSPFLWKVLHCFVELTNKVTTVLICLLLSTSASVVRGLLAERLWASGHFSGGLAGVAGGDAPSLCPILRVIEAMWWLLCRRSPGVCSLAHAHTHHGGICSDTHLHTTCFNLEQWMIFKKWEDVCRLTWFVFSDLCAADENLLHETRAHWAALRRAQPVWVQVIKQPFHCV